MWGGKGKGKGKVTDPSGYQTKVQSCGAEDWDQRCLQVSSAGAEGSSGFMAELTREEGGGVALDALQNQGLGDSGGRSEVEDGEFGEDLGEIRRGGGVGSCPEAVGGDGEGRLEVDCWGPAFFTGGSLYCPSLGVPSCSRWSKRDQNEQELMQKTRGLRGGSWGESQLCGSQREAVGGLSGALHTSEVRCHPGLFNSGGAISNASG